MNTENELYIRLENEYMNRESNEEKISDMLEVMLFDYGMI